MRPTVLLPHGIARNRYVDELAQAWRGLGFALVQGPQALFEAQHRPALVHLQWPEELYRWHGSGPPQRRARDFIDRLDALKAGGARLAWTVHNLAPHDHPDDPVDHAAYQAVIDRADLLIHHGEPSRALLRQRHTVGEIREIVLPHGHFGGYPQGGDRAATRARLRLPADATVFLHFGLIRGYKGLDLLLDAYRAARVPRKRLVIAGTWAIAPQGQPLGERLRMAWIRRWARTIRCEFRHVADDEIRDFMAAADAVVLAHRQVLNSGVAVLGMSFGKLVVGPDTGCVGPLLAEGVNERYPAGDTAGLARAMERAADPARIAAARVNATIARGWDWERNAAAIVAALGIPAPDRQSVLVEVS
ncbi:MAG: glycosyltransferase [Betaproteobacteria bacterium]|nr:glycosyltransferase [Betaproteobacteria bacterium]